MLKGDVFSEQLFENHIFALFINTFLNGNNGVARDYKNGMNLTYSGNQLTIASGAVCIQGRFLEEDTSTTLTASGNNMYCRLVIEIDLDKTNTPSNFTQGYYKILSNSNTYPSLTQTNIVKNVSGIYQYELAQFRTSTNGTITYFADKRTYLDIESIYDAIESATNSLISDININAEDLITDLREELQESRDESLYLLKSDLYYRDGEAYRANARNIYAGYITDSAEMIRFTIPLPKRLPSNAMTFRITTLKLTIRGINGYITTTLGQDVLETIQEDFIVDDDKITISIGHPGGWNNAVNNTPVAINLNNTGDVTIAFSRLPI